MELIRPRFVAIDSSVLASWAKDAFAPDLESKARARITQKQLLENNWIPIICLHHFIELARHSDLQAVAERIAFLKSFSHMAWISRSYGLKFYGPKLLGGIVDVFEAEVWAIAEFPEITIAHLRTAVRQKIVQYTNPSEITILDEWRDLHPILQSMAIQEQEIASIVHAHDSAHDDSKISQLRSKQTTQITSRHPTLEEIEKLEKDLTNRGDPRLADPSRTAQGFLNMVARNLTEALARGGSALDVFIEQLDIPKTDITEETTLREVKTLARRRKLLKVAAMQLGLDVDKIWPNLRRAKIPSEMIQVAIRNARKSSPQASGSDLGDDYLACLAPYVDAVIIDKRTHEFMVQSIRRDPSLSKIISFFAKVSSYQQLPDALPN
jgi:hypothetical protein